ncbi:transcriptional activator RfaH [Alphaproteobacteria bacterium]|nr:transcriptional activator RfaH [Alphaproteobacteria bacterium]
MTSWYVVYTHQGSERLAEGHLKRQGFETYLPLYRKITRHARRVAEITAPLFPRYIFVAIDVSAQRWHSINGTFGVNHLVAMGERPVALPAGVVDEIRAREVDGGLVKLEQPPPLQERRNRAHHWWAPHRPGGPFSVLERKRSRERTA